MISSCNSYTYLERHRPGIFWLFCALLFFFFFLLCKGVTFVLEFGAAKTKKENKKMRNIIHVPGYAAANSREILVEGAWCDG
ncbi:hypothetical protein TRIATDRAFT_255859 [Trichoderma atroviride IMI 206040]|uniref:Uncharacterized protein n=1 Tax=Hypocrea atroviridis (strain ATCC 20476 / IMI 206040) TaxID=452589 RepID=G9NPA8_HYPAI|nr:uncharacterized protein TRIATDRAFT_298532 [Trichoderma atroviride IMI 206040]EHK47379.1 hypothetical protein TRIATDRAFT_255859 [Trichoderma atroviride IMI 206040]